MLADHMSEKGMLQMLLDVRFLRASLAEGRPRSAASSAPPAPPAAQPRQGPPRGARDGPGQQLQDWFQGLETTLQVRARLAPPQALCGTEGGCIMPDVCRPACEAKHILILAAGQLLAGQWGWMSRHPLCRTKRCLSHIGGDSMASHRSPLHGWGSSQALRVP